MSNMVVLRGQNMHLFTKLFPALWTRREALRFARNELGICREDLTVCRLYSVVSYS